MTARTGRAISLLAYYSISNNTCIQHAFSREGTYFIKPAMHIGGITRTTYHEKLWLKMLESCSADRNKLKQATITTSCVIMTRVSRLIKDKIRRRG